MMLPILYSFRRCPYAMRARLALRQSGIQVEWREVDLRHKPESMLACSPKGEVPVLLLPDGHVIDQSLDIMFWALQQRDPAGWLVDADGATTKDLIRINDGSFKQALDRYKYADRFPDQPAEVYRAQGEIFLQQLDTRLRTQRCLLADEVRLLDMAVFPFVRQFAFVDEAWFRRTPYTCLVRWLDHLLQSDLFQNIMLKTPVWRPGEALVVF